MQSQYTDKARTALILAEKAARKLKQNYVGTEHILLGLLEEGTGVAARVSVSYTHLDVYKRQVPCPVCGCR